ncbi:hypothetical protein AMJ57_02045 [Parcubacteria bacterium SG8_24]|nr:MAG: hypothetical protein AMJ57_02045 [Parcubacteria bacterium SG8_24]
MPTYRDSGVVLHSRYLRDFDRRYVMFLRDHGKVTLLAKGTRRSRSKMSPHLSSFGMVDVMVAKGKFMDRLAGVRLFRPFPRIIESLEKTAAAQSFFLAVDALTRRELKEERLFDLLVGFLESLEAEEIGSGVRRSAVFDAAILKLTDILGTSAEIDECVICRRTPESGGVLDVFRGGIICPACRPISGVTVSASTLGFLRELRDRPLGQVPFSGSAGERSAISAVVDALLLSQIEDRFAALRYLRSVSSGPGQVVDAAGDGPGQAAAGTEAVMRACQNTEKLPK